jgi:hypothetical protein
VLKHLSIGAQRFEHYISDNLIMYTVTSDATLRIFFPVLDAPDFLQLHASLDLNSSLPVFVVEQLGSAASTVFWLDRKAVDRVITNILGNDHLADDARARRLREIKEESWDLFLRILIDGSIVVSAVAVSKLCCFDESLSMAPIRIWTGVLLLYFSTSQRSNPNQECLQNLLNTSMCSQIWTLASSL